MIHIFIASPRIPSYIFTGISPNLYVSKKVSKLSKVVAGSRKTRLGDAKSGGVDSRWCMCSLQFGGFCSCFLTEEQVLGGEVWCLRDTDSVEAPVLIFFVFF